MIMIHIHTMSVIMPRKYAVHRLVVFGLVISRTEVLGGRNREEVSVVNEASKRPQRETGRGGELVAMVSTSVQC